MRTTELTLENLDAAAAAIPADTPVTMLNMLKFKRRADYEDGEGEPCSGREAYQRFRAAFSRVTEGAGVEVVWVGGVVARLVAPAGAQWEDVAIVQYPNFAAFRRLVESPRYQAEAAPHRKAAVEDWRLFAMTKG